MALAIDTTPSFLPTQPQDICSTEMTISRRILQFASLEEAVADAESLLKTGYVKTGNWDLSQCCDHMTRVMLYPMDGFPQFPIHLRVATFILRFTIAPMMLKKMLRSNKWPERVPTDQQSIPARTELDALSAQKFRSAVSRLLEYNGPWKTSPLFGLLPKETLVHLHRIHCAHHLGFLVPENIRDSYAELS